MHTRRLQDGSRPDSPSPIQTLDMLDEVYYYLAPDGRLPQWNDRVPEVTGYTHGETEEMSATEFFGPEDRDEVASAVATAVTEKRQVTVEGAVFAVELPKAD